MIRTILALLILVLAPIACARSELPATKVSEDTVVDGGGRPLAPEPTATSSVPTLTLGISAPLSGASARVGLAERRFIELAIEEINARGGIQASGQAYRVAPLIADDGFSSPGGRLASERLVLREQVRFVLGTMSMATAGAQPVTEPNRSLLLALSSPDQSLGPAFPFTFQVGVPHKRMRVAALFQVFVAANPGARRLVLVDGDQPGQSTADVEHVARTAGFTVVGTELVPADLRDFTPLDRRIVGLNPDALYVGANIGALFPALLQTLDEEGFRKPAFGLFADAAAMRDAAPFAEGYIAPLLADRNATVVGAAEREVIERYVQRYGESQLELSPRAMYNAPLILAQAIQQAGAIEDTEKLATVLRSGEWETIWSQQWGKARFAGAQTFDLAQLLEQPIYFSKVQNGKVVTFQALKGTLP